MGQPCPIIITFVIDENLRFILQPSESRRMHNPVSVTLEGCSILWFGIMMLSPFTVTAEQGVRCKCIGFDLFKSLAVDDHTLLLWLTMLIVLVFVIRAASCFISPQIIIPG